MRRPPLPQPQRRLPVNYESGNIHVSGLTAVCTFEKSKRGFSLARPSLIDNYHDDPDFPDAPEERPRKVRLSRDTIILLGLLLVGITLAAAWKAAGGPSFASLMSPPASQFPTGASLARSDLEQLRQQVLGQLQSAQQLTVTKQAELKRLADQVTALSVKLDQIQRPAPAAIPAASASIPAKKKNETLKPAGGVSVGGNPLPPSR